MSAEEDTLASCIAKLGKPVVVYMNGRHYRVSQVRMCGDRIEIIWDRSNPLEREPFE